MRDEGVAVVSLLCPCFGLLSKGGTFTLHVSHAQHHPAGGFVVWLVFTLERALLIHGVVMQISVPADSVAEGHHRTPLDASGRAFWLCPGDVEG